MKLWGGALLAFLGVCGALWLYVETGAGDCLDCPAARDQALARALLPLSFLVWVTVLVLRAALARNVWEAIGAGVLAALAALSGLALLWILTSN